MSTSAAVQEVAVGSNDRVEVVPSWIAQFMYFEALDMIRER